MRLAHNPNLPKRHYGLTLELHPNAEGRIEHAEQLSVTRHRQQVTVGSLFPAGELLGMPEPRTELRGSELSARAKRRLADAFSELVFVNRTGDDSALEVVFELRRRVNRMMPGHNWQIKSPISTNVTLSALSGEKDLFEQLHRELGLKPLRIRLRPDADGLVRGPEQVTVEPLSE
jgi:hypothetical protein